MRWQRVDEGHAGIVESDKQAVRNGGGRSASTYDDAVNLTRDRIVVGRQFFFAPELCTLSQYAKDASHQFLS
jgi:hypothetical protein